MSVVTRFPPSPTGFMHVGNARTALFNYLYARRHGGKFLVRIEDTDRKRHSEEAVQVIFEGLEWMGLEYDGEALSQFAGMGRHAEVAHEMLKAGKAYYCYCSPEELEAMRETAKAEGRSQFYDRRWRDRDPSEAPQDIKPVVRIKAPLEGETTINDVVQGAVTVAHDQLDDFILLRSDGTPTYMLSVVVDDHDMGVTHILRGDDHLNNSFRQKLIFDAMGWTLPVFGHLPLIHGPDGGKFSKRHGAQSVREYKELGYLPEAFCNYLLRLGWSHGDDEIISREQAIEWFDLEHIGRSPARFDFAKLDSLNAHYIKEARPERLLECSREFYKERHGLELSDIAVERITLGIEELKARSKTLLQFVDESAFYARSIPYAFDEKALALLGESKAILAALEDELESLEPFTGESIQNLCQKIAGDLAEGKLGKVAMPLRAAVTGTTVSPSIFGACAVLGRKETCARIRFAVQQGK
ncbi:MAG: glutamate--tRNA ligase [Alphaproteobacteria bacterium]|nr:glutamate--tRNA ligase [Alphaproteobacteria bacterium]